MAAQIYRKGELTTVMIIIIINPQICIILNLLSFSDLLHTFSHIFIHFLKLIHLIE